MAPIAPATRGRRIARRVLVVCLWLFASYVILCAGAYFAMVQPPDVFACGCAGAATAKIGKSSTDYNLAVGLHRQSFDIAIRTGIEAIESRLSPRLRCEQQQRHQHHRCR